MNRDKLINDYIYDPITGLFIRRHNKGKWNLEIDLQGQ